MPGEIVLVAGGVVGVVGLSSLLLLQPTTVARVIEKINENNVNREDFITNGSYLFKRKYP
jgi:hypothetical protein